MKKGEFSRFRFLAASFIVLALSSCATLTRDQTETIQINSDPQGAAVVASDGQTGTTPFSIVVPRRQGLVLHFSKDGYQSVDITDESKLSTKYAVVNGASYAAALLVPPLLLVPFANSASGADREHQTNEVSVKLEPLVSASAVGAASSSPVSTPSSVSPPPTASN